MDEPDRHQARDCRKRRLAEPSTLLWWLLGQRNLGDPQLQQLQGDVMVKLSSSGKVEQCLLDDAEPIKGAAIVGAKGSEDDVGEIE